MKLNKFNLEKYFKKYSYSKNKIVGIDPEDEGQLLLLENGILSNISRKEVKQDYLISSYIPNREVITYELTIAKNLLDKIELDDYVETKCYEEAGLDDTAEYIFKHKIVDSEIDNKNIMVEVVIVSKDDMLEKYQDLKNDFGYLDYLAYPGYIFDVLYKENIIEQHNDLFIYFIKNDIFITLYSDGKFLQTSIIPEGLETIYEELLHNINIKNITFDIFLNLLVKKGLNLDNYSEREAELFNQISEIFSNKFLIISNQINSMVRKFSLTTIERIYMSTIKGVIPGISEFANMYLGVEANDLKFDLNYNPNNIEVDQLVFLSMLSTQYAYKTEKLEDNFSIFERAPTFFYRQSGQLISISIASLLVAMLYPIYEEVNTFVIDSSNQTYQQQLNKLKHKNSQLTKINKKLLSEFNKKKSEKEGIEKYIKDRNSIIDTMYKEKKGYIPRASFIAKISGYLYRNDVYLQEIRFGDSIEAKNSKQNKNNKTTKNKDKEIAREVTSKEKDKFLVLNVYSKDESKITNFIDDLVKNEHMIVTTPGYQSDGNYTAEITIKVGK